MPITADTSIAFDAAFDAALEGPRGANPLVGASIIAPDGSLLSVGRHRGAGTPHAEIDALDRLPAAAAARGATMIVTLEPCRHRGRTGPCAEAIAASGIARVIVGTPDPTPLAGGGSRVLADAGVRVDFAQGDAAARSRGLNRRWFQSQGESRPFVTAKIAASIDGRIAAADGSSRWITGVAAREHGHRLRARADAILVGAGTAEIDRPRLTARLSDGTPAERQPLRVVLGRRALKSPPDLQLPTHDPGEALGELWRRGIRHVLVEGGPTVMAAFLRNDLVDDLEVFTAPVLLGKGPAAVAGIGVSAVSGARRFRPDPAEGGPVRSLGPDVWQHLAPD